MTEIEREKPFFTRDDVELIDSPVQSGKFKRVLRAQMIKTGEVVAIKLPRVYTAGDKTETW